MTKGEKKRLYEQVIAAARQVRKAGEVELEALRALYLAVRERDSLKIEDAVFAVARAQVALASAEAVHSGFYLALKRGEVTEGVDHGQER